MKEKGFSSGQCILIGLAIGTVAGLIALILVAGVAWADEITADECRYHPELCAKLINVQQTIIDRQEKELASIRKAVNDSVKEAKKIADKYKK